MSRIVSQGRIRTIPDNVFFKLWKKTETSKPEYMEFGTQIYKRKWDIQYEYYLDMLDDIYEMANKPIKAILSDSGTTKAKASQTLCIPLRTLENWYSNISPCPGYMRLMMLRYFGQFKMRHFIYIESEKPEQQKRVVVKEPPKHATITLDQYDSFQRWEQEHVHSQDNSAKDLLERLKYLDKYIK